MIKKLRDLISNFSEKTEDADIQDITDLDNACAALLVEIAFADKDFDESEQDSLKKSLMECYKISEEDINEIIEALKRTGEADEIDKDKLIGRVDCIKQWIKNYAPESVVFEIQKEKPDINFDETETLCAKLLSGKFKEIEWTPEIIHNSFYELQEESKIPAKKFFKVVYNAILDKDRGPRLGFFLATMDKNFIIERGGVLRTRATRPARPSDMLGKFRRPVRDRRSFCCGRRGARPQPAALRKPSAGLRMPQVADEHHAHAVQLRPRARCLRGGGLVVDAVAERVVEEQHLALPAEELRLDGDVERQLGGLLRRGRRGL